MKHDVHLRASRPVFRDCPRCSYSLRGLPANHACPECSLHFDERCELYRATNPKKVLIAWLGILGPGWIVLQNIPHVLNFGAASAWEKIGAGAAVAWFFFVGFAAYSLVKRYRRGFEVAETGDGLIVRLPGFNDDAIPWADIGQALVVKVPEGKPKVAAVFLRSKEKNVYIGQLANVFRTAIDVERFVGQVHARSLPSRRDDTESIPPGNWCGD